MPEDNLAHKVTRTLILLRVHLNATTTHQKLYGRVVTCLVCGELCGIKYIKGQNERRAIRTLTAVVGGRVGEDSDIRFARRLCS